MQTLALVILEHTAACGRHFDLLIEDPTVDPAAGHRLFAARLAVAPHQWARARRLALVPLPHHRAVYLQHQGPIGGHRGRVRRVDRGHAIAHRWTGTLVELDITTAGFRGRLTLRRRGPACWLGVADPATSSSVASAAAAARTWPR